MNNENLELFRAAIKEGLSNRVEETARRCGDDISYSERHSLAMRTIIYGKYQRQRALSPRMRRIIAILVAAALLLTSCGIAFRNEIQEIFNELFIVLNYGKDGEEGKDIDHVYVLDYLPNGYTLEVEEITSSFVRYVYSNEQDQVISFVQMPINNSEIVIDKENGYSELVEVNGFSLYCRYEQNVHYYAWVNTDYVFTLYCDCGVSESEIFSIIEGITAK